MKNEMVIFHEVSCYVCGKQNFKISICRWGKKGKGKYAIGFCCIKCDPEKPILMIPWEDAKQLKGLISLEVDSLKK